MADYLIQDSTLTDIADAIRAKTGGSSAMTPAEMVEAIGSISGGGGSEITKDEWTAASDVNGTTQSFYYGQSYVDRSFVGVQIIDITNNSATSNKAERVIIDTRSERPGRMDAFFRAGSVTIISSGQSFNWTAGTVFTRYKIPSSVFPA